MRKYEKYSEGMGYGIAAFFSSFLFLGSSALIYFLKFKDKNPPLIEKIVLLIFIVPFFLAGIWLFFNGLVTIIQNLFFKRSRIISSSGNFISINLHPLAGVNAFIVSVIFTLLVVLFLYPNFRGGKEDTVELWFFIVGAILFFIYALAVFLVNIIKRIKKKRGSKW